MVCAGCGNVPFDSNCSCHLIVPELKEETVKLRAVNEELSNQANKWRRELNGRENELAKAVLQLDELKALILRGAPECPEDDPCSCMRCRIKKLSQNQDDEDTCSKCGWSGSAETAQGYAAWSRSLHEVDGKSMCSHCGGC